MLLVTSSFERTKSKYLSILTRSVISSTLRRTGSNTNPTSLKTILAVKEHIHVERLDGNFDELFQAYISVSVHSQKRGVVLEIALNG